MIVDREHIEDYIPQRSPMIMIDGLSEAESLRAVSVFEIPAGNLFVADGRFTEAGLVENIAQTAAAHAGWLCKQEGREISLGFIAAIRNLQIHGLPSSGSAISTIVEVTNKVFDVTIINGTVFHKETPVCSCEMRIFIKE